MLRERRGIQSVLQLEHATEQLLIEDDMKSLARDSNSQISLWADHSPKANQFTLAPKRLREEDDASMLDVAMPELMDETQYVQTNVILKPINLKDLRKDKVPSGSSTDDMQFD